MSAFESYRRDYRGTEALAMRNPKTGHINFVPPPPYTVISEYYNTAFSRSTEPPSPKSEFTQQFLDEWKNTERLFRTRGGFGESYSFHDIGCGFGATVWAMQQIGLIASGNEANCAWVEAANPHCQFKLSTAPLSECLGSLGYKVDVYFCAHVLEHLVNPLATMKLVASHISPNGLFYICVPNAHCKPILHSGITNPGFAHCFSFPMHLHYFTPKSLFHMLRACGFDVIDLATRSLFDDKASKVDCDNLLGFELYMLATPSKNVNSNLVEAILKRCDDAYAAFMANDKDAKMLSFPDLEYQDFVLQSPAT
jgi:2-polyprenyl-3-methyl-5-hydroxy-6-metoxy-1,4-benzoquinol methylase